MLRIAPCLLALVAASARADLLRRGFRDQRHLDGELRLDRPDARGFFLLEGIAPLSDETVDDAIKREAVIKLLARERLQGRQYRRHLLLGLRLVFDLGAVARRSFEEGAGLGEAAKPSVDLTHVWAISLAAAGNYRDHCVLDIAALDLVPSATQLAYTEFVKVNQVGYTPLAAPDRYMERWAKDVYRRGPRRD